LQLLRIYNNMNEIAPLSVTRSAGHKNWRRFLKKLHLKRIIEASIFFLGVIITIVIGNSFIIFADSFFWG
jgi:hypothetical protein